MPGRSSSTSAAAASLSGQLLLGLRQLQESLPQSPQLNTLAAAIRDRHGDAVQAIIYYGSCLRSGKPDQGIADFYVIVDSYQRAQMGRIRAWLNHWLPPNVFYLETEHRSQDAATQTLRAKYAVISTAQFLHGVSGGWQLPYLWARFAQPAGLLWTRDGQIADRVLRAMIAGQQHFLHESLALMNKDFSARELWQQGLLHSYATELRAERLSRIKALYDCWPDYYARQTAVFMQAQAALQADADGRYVWQADAAGHAAAQRRWQSRRRRGKLMSVLRLSKSLFTFSGAVDYAAWKVERHSGQPVQLSPLARRWPLIGGWVVLWRLLRSGSLR
ncbi:MAG: hypothetical protein KKC01_08270 [Gammaproteobacteria bacterium]|nr:hypothetical protein [Gammaproteobacteria bacterium]